METNRAEVIEMIVATINEFEKLSTKRKKLYVEVACFENDDKKSTKVYFGIGYEYIGHITLNKNEFKPLMDMTVKRFRYDDIRYNVELYDRMFATRHIPKNRLNLEHCCYNEDIEAIEQYTRIGSLKNIDRGFVANEFPNLIMEDEKNENRGPVPFVVMSLKTDKGNNPNNSENRGPVPFGMGPLKTEINNRDTLLTEIVEIHKRDTYTNSEAMCNDFTIENKILLRSIDEILIDFPLLIKSVFWSIYKDGIHFNKYIHITQDMYKKILETVPSSTNRAVMRKRMAKKDEYYDAFKVMRDWFEENGYDNKFLEKLYNKRKQGTTNLMILMESVLRSSGKESELLKRCLFNNINYRVGIDAKNFTGAECNRDNLDELTQDLLLKVEKIAMDVFKKHIGTVSSPKEVFGIVNYFLHTNSLENIIYTRSRNWLHKVDGMEDEEYSKLIDKFAFYNPYHIIDRKRV